MSGIVSEKLKYDPWEAQQEIADLKIALHCCRYWMLSEWECENLSFPFWRLYHSRTGGSYVTFDGREVELSSEKLILIPPYTSFSTHIKELVSTQNESIKGVKIGDEQEIDIYKSIGMCDQFFAHFNLGYTFDKIKADIYEVELTDYWLRELSEIEGERLMEPNVVTFLSNLKISGLILFALQSLPRTLWYFPEIDKRVLRVINFIDKNLNAKLTNKELSDVANLATNSFARLFRELLKFPVQQYIQQKRIEKAIMLLHHSDIEMDEIATKCGFCDRHHFSKVFKKHTGFPPVSYRKKIGGN